jgi:hypothetical protein
MASGHVNRENKAEHMAAPHRNLQRDDSPCQFGAVHTWPVAAVRGLMTTSAFGGRADHLRFSEVMQR